MQPKSNQNDNGKSSLNLHISYGLINVSFFLFGFSSSICYFQVERSIRNIRNGLNPTDETTDTQPKDASSKRDNKRETLNMLNVENITLTDELIEKIPDEYFQRTVKVVFLFRRRHTMKAAGLLRPMPDKNPNYALFSPMDR